MTPADEALIALWQQALETAAIAERLGIKATTAQSRAHRLQQRGLIEPRPRGENYPTQRRQAVLAGVSPDTHEPLAGVSRRTPTDSPPLQYLPPSQGEMLPLLHDIWQELHHLTGQLAARVSPDTPGVHHDIPRVLIAVSDGVSVRTALPTERGHRCAGTCTTTDGCRNVSRRGRPYGGCRIVR
jgi:hypothetical protein